MTPHEGLSQIVDTVHRQSTAIWFIYPRVLAVVGGEWAGTLEAAGWTVVHDTGVGSVVHAADMRSAEFPKLWQALCRAESGIPREAVTIENEDA